MSIIELEKRGEKCPHDGREKNEKELRVKEIKGSENRVKGGEKGNGIMDVPQCFPYYH